MAFKRILSVGWIVCVIVVSLCPCLHDTALAQKQPDMRFDITGAHFERLPIAVPDFKYMSSEQTQLAREMADTLRSDLDFSGVCRSLDPKGFLEDPQTMGMNAGEIKFPDWRRLGADFLARAGYSVQGSTVKIEARLFDVASSRMVVGKVYEGDARTWRAMVHRFADEILFALTGERGVFDTKIAFVQAQGKGKEIYVMDFDGNNVMQVTRDNSIAPFARLESSGKPTCLREFQGRQCEALPGEPRGWVPAAALRLSRDQYRAGVEAGDE